MKERKRPVVELSIERDMPVVKSNLLIQKSRYSLSVQEQKIVLYIISKIKPEDTGLQEYTFDIKDFCKVVGIDYDNGKNYKNLKSTVKNLADKSMWITLDNGTETLLRWIERPYINKGSGIVKLKLDEYLMPYLLQLKEHFTQYSLYHILAMKSQYSVRLYELLKSYQNMNTWTFSIDKLKHLLGAETYHLFADFRRKVLEVAVKEIELYSDISVNYELMKKGRAYESIKFKIVRKKNPVYTIENVQHALNEYAPWENRPKK